MGRRPTEVQVSGQAGQEARPTLLRVAGAGYRDLLDPAATEVLQQENHLVFLVRGTRAAKAAAGALEIENGFGQLRAALAASSTTTICGCSTPQKRRMG